MDGRAEELAQNRKDQDRVKQLENVLATSLGHQSRLMEIAHAAKEEKVKRKPW